MAKVKIEQLVEEMVHPILMQQHCELVDIEYTKEGSHWYLRIYIDKPGGVTIDDCQAVSEQVSSLLDKRIRFPTLFS